MEVEGCEEHRPLLSLNVINDILDENAPDETAELVLSSELPLVEPITVVLEASGSADLNDFVGGLEVILPAGQESVSIPLEVSVDSLVEGVETLTLNIPDDQAEFAAGAELSQSLTIVDFSEVTFWLTGFFPADSPNLTGDSDGDGLSELEEYLLGTDPTSRASSQVFDLQPFEAGGFLIPLGELPQRSDATLGVEFSSDLISWEPGPFEQNDEGILLTPIGLKNFVRLTFSLNE